MRRPPTQKEKQGPSKLVPARADLLVELGCEELPAAEQPPLIDDFETALVQALATKNIQHGEVRAYVTPRHLAVFIAALQLHQADHPIKRRGPSVDLAFDAKGKATSAGLGFARSCGVRPDQLTRKKHGTTQYLYYEGMQKGSSAQILLPQMLTKIVPNLPRRQTMRWDTESGSFTRAVRWLVLMLDDQVVPWQAFGLTSANKTYGHRGYCPKPLIIKRAADYARLLRTKGWVIVSSQERKQLILHGAQDLIKQKTGQAKVQLHAPADLVDELVAITEYPTVYEGQFDKRFLQLPSQVLNSVLITHQRCFPVLDTKGKHVPRFIFVANIKSNKPAQLIAGNEAVIRPRLQDAVFFYERDRNQGLNLAKLADLAFFGDLGNMHQKSLRCVDLIQTIAPFMDVPAKTAAEAARLSKCDLTSLMVQEFPALQGIMGGHYLRLTTALAAEVMEECATAIEQHYLPRQSGDPIPSSAMGCALSIVDRLDNLVGLIAQGHMPSGDKDPYGLRRQAQGLVRIILTNKTHLDLRVLLQTAAQGYRTHNRRAIADATCGEVLLFINERVFNYAEEQGLDNDAVATAFAAPQADLTDGWLRAAALMKIPHQQRALLVKLNKRLKNILTEDEDTEDVDLELMKEPAEKRLYAAYRRVNTAYQRAAKQRQYARCCQILTQLSALLEDFFNEVLVMTDDPRLRQNRLRLLRLVRKPFVHLGDLSRLISKPNTTEK